MVSQQPLRDALVQRFTARGQTPLAPRPLPASDFTDHLPVPLEELAQALREGGPPTERVFSTRGTAGEQGRQRPGDDVRGRVREYGPARGGGGRAAEADDLFEQAPVAVCIHEGPRHTYTFANAAYRALSGDKDVVGKPLLEALPELEGLGAQALPELKDQGFMELLERVLRTGEPFVGRGVPATFDRSPDAPREQFFFDFVYHPVRGSEGNDAVLVLTGARRQGVELEVHNTGTPIAPEDLGRLFQPMQRATTLPDSAGRSVGLGLQCRPRGSVGVCSRAA